ncbi:hypothetical protein [Kitasatospora sp. NPDC058218]|uniref:hypothetical protein n=1 Tax=Kitasatospora sp. NPDC058218 TaxID=3346385 RepID=UPI0036D94893
MADVTNSITGGFLGTAIQGTEIVVTGDADGGGLSFTPAPADPALWLTVFNEALRISADGGGPEDLAAWADEAGLSLSSASPTSSAPRSGRWWRRR